jgi:hypothetical protein
MPRHFTGLLIASLVFASDIQAATLDFLTANQPETPNSQVMPTGPASLVSIKAATTSDHRVVAQDYSSAMAYSEIFGLGVLGNAGGDQTDSPQIDSHGSEDAVVFTFDRTVRLDSISLTLTDWWDRFDLYLGPDLVYQRTFKVDDFRGLDWTSTVLFGEAYQAQTFAIAASRYTSCGYDIGYGHGCWTENSAFSISALSITDLETPEVPLPATVWLCLAALGSLIALKRRQA